MTTETISGAAQRFLLDTAVEAIRAHLEHRRLGPVPIPDAEPGPPIEAREPGASFVTLREGRQLLGCVGSMSPVRPLQEDVAANALNAAFADPRLPLLTPGEFETMEVKVSVLGPLEPIEVRSLTQLAAVVRPGVDGLLVSGGSHRGTFLPSVWEQVTSVEEFLSMLWSKAGLRPGAWPRGLHVERYQTTEFGDPGPRRPIDGRRS